MNFQGVDWKDDDVSHVSSFVVAAAILKAYSVDFLRSLVDFKVIENIFNTILNTITNSTISKKALTKTKIRNFLIFLLHLWILKKSFDYELCRCRM